MKILQVKKFKSSQMHNVFDNIKTFELEDKAFDSGAFGEVYFCLSANGKALPTPQVVKILIDDGSGSAKAGIRTIQNLQDKIVNQNQLLKSSSQKTIDQISCLYALPQLSFEGTLNGKAVFGYSQNKIDTKEFILFKDFFDEPDFYKRKKNRDDFQKLSIESRLKLGYDLAEGFQSLRDMAYIHADLNPKNLFIKFNPPGLILIDYDSGVVVNNQEDKADTFGQLGGWIAPEIQAQLLQNSNGIIKVDLNTDTWAVAVAIHYLIFLFHPLDFLKIRGKREMQLYFDKNQWPEFNIKEKNFREELLNIYNKYTKIIQNNIPDSVLKALKVTINEGYFNPGRRVTYRQWLKILSGAASSNNIEKLEAEIISFYSEKIRTSPGESVTLSWDVKNASKISLNGKEILPSIKSISVNPFSTIQYLLEVTGSNGITKSSSINIEVKNKKIPTVNRNLNQAYIDFLSKGKPLSLTFERFFLVTGLIISVIAIWFFISKSPSLIYFLPFVIIGITVFEGIVLYSMYKNIEIVEAKKLLFIENKKIEIENQVNENEIKKLKNIISQIDERIKQQQRKLGKETLLLREREKIEGDVIRKKHENQLNQLQKKISESKKVETEDLKNESDKLYKKIINAELFKYLIIDADIDGIQFIFKGILTFNGIFTAADIVEIDQNGNILKPNGEWIRLNALTKNKVKKLWEWKQNVINEIKRKFPQALTADQKKQIRQKHSDLINQLMKDEYELQQNQLNKLQNLTQQVDKQIARFSSINMGSIIREKEDSEKKLKILERNKFLNDNEMLNGLKRIEIYNKINFANYLKRIIGFKILK